MKLLFRAASVALAFALAGCAVAPQQPIAMAPTSLDKARVGVVMTPLPKVELNLPGAGCLLCMAAASMANSTLSTYTATLPYEDLPKLKNQVAQSLAKRTKDVVVIDEPLDLKTLPDATGTGPNLPRKDFSSLQKKLGVDKLMVIEVSAVGMERVYSGYIPTGEPKSIVAGSAYMVNLSNNTYEWYHPVRVMRAADGKWDEPPKFPGLTNAYFQALELGKDEFLRPLTTP